MKRILSLTIFVCLIFCYHADARDGTPLVRASLDRREAHIGDKIIYRIEVIADKSTSIEIPEFKDNLIGEFEIKEHFSRTENKLFGRRRIIKSYIVSIYSVGKKTVPAIEIRYKPKSAKSWSGIKTLAVDINIKSVLPAGKEITDIKDVKGPLSFFEINWMLVILLFITVIIIGLLITLYIKKKNAKTIKLPHETALEEMERTRALFLQGGDIKEYYVGISDCVRRYIERRFALRAPEMTTEEFLESLKDSAALLPDQKSLMREFLNACDLVKFARHNPARQESEVVFEKAKNFIDQTKEVPGNMEKQDLKK